jgi:uncharacterized protein Yka (UPF0111/DUF47 family)
MAGSSTDVDGVENLLDRLSRASERLLKASEEQAGELDRQLKNFVDRGQAATERMLEALDKEVRAQVASLRREVKQLEQRITELRKTTAAKIAPARKTAAKNAPAKRASAKKVAR